MTDGAERRTPRVVAVSGASGMIGRALTEALERDAVEVRSLVRGRAGTGEISWDPVGGTVDIAALRGVDAVVHLAGEPIGERWTEERKRRIMESRRDGTRTLATALASMEQPPSVLVSPSAVGYYGDRGDEILREDSGPGSDFLARVAQEWEAGLKPAEDAGIRVVRLRFGVVLSSGGGALERMLPPFRLGAGGRLGSGRQWMSWVTLDDVIGAIRFAMDRSELRGVYNTVAPEPVTNGEFTRVLGSVLGRPAFFQVPAMALRLAFGEMAEATLLASQRVDSTKLREAGYTFRHARLEEALRAVLGR
jgi:uncharacterized protein